MKTLVAIISIFGTIFLDSVNGISFIPNPPIVVDPHPGVVCTLDIKICAVGQYLGTGTSGCPECLPCLLAKIGCPNGDSPIQNPRQENQCPTWYCPNVMCTLDLKICAEGQYLGTGTSGCPKCLQCPLRKIVCPNGVSPIKNPREENKCPTWYCPRPVVCTKEMKICAANQYLGTGANGCPECLPCRIAFPSCPAGSSPRRNPAVLNQCPTYTCSRRCIGIRCFDPIGPIDIQPVVE